MDLRNQKTKSSNEPNVYSYLSEEMAQDETLYALNNMILRHIVSDDIDVDNGVIILHILDESRDQYKELSDVESQIKSSLLKELKKVYAEDMLSNLGDWEAWNNDDHVKIERNQSNQIKGPFPGINSSSEITGTLLALDSGETSIISSDSRSSFIIKVNNKDEIDLDDFEAHLQQKKLETYKRSSQNPYTTWMRDKKKNTENEFYGNEIY